MCSWHHLYDGTFSMSIKIVHFSTVVRQCCTVAGPMEKTSVGKKTVKKSSQNPPKTLSATIQKSLQFFQNPHKS